MSLPPKPGKEPAESQEGQSQDIGDQRIEKAIEFFLAMIHDAFIDFSLMSFS
jgi:hypothetical protein